MGLISYIRLSCFHLITVLTSGRHAASVDVGVLAEAPIFFATVLCASTVWCIAPNAVCPNSLFLPCLFMARRQNTFLDWRLLSAPLQAGHSFVLSSLLFLRGCVDEIGPRSDRIIGAYRCWVHTYVNARATPLLCYSAHGRGMCFHFFSFHFSHAPTSNAWQVVGGTIKKVGETSPVSDPDGVVDLVKVCMSFACQDRQLSLSRLCVFTYFVSFVCLPGEHLSTHTFHVRGTARKDRMPVLVLMRGNACTRRYRAGDLFGMSRRTAEDGS